VIVRFVDIGEIVDQHCFFIPYSKFGYTEFHFIQGLV